MAKLRKISRVLEFNLEYLSAFFLFLIMASVFGEVITRYFLGESHGYMEEFTRWFQIWIAFLMLGVVEKRRKHIAINILPAKLTGKANALLMSVISLCNLAVAAVLTWSGIQLIQQLRMAGILSQTEIPTPEWIVRLCVPLGAVLLGFFSVEHLVKDIARVIGKSKEEGTNGNH